MRMTKSERRIIRHLKRVYGIEEQNAKRKKEKVSGQFMNRVVIAMILAAFIFTVVMIFVFVRTGSEPSTLIENVFRFLSVEGGAMALIKSVKTVTRRKSESESENQHEANRSSVRRNDDEIHHGELVCACSVGSGGSSGRICGIYFRENAVR